MKMITIVGLFLGLVSVSCYGTPESAAENTQSFDSGVYRKPLSAKEKGSFQYYEDFESADPVSFGTSYGRKYTVNFKGLTEEHAFSGKKAFKLDVTFEQPGRYIWYIHPKRISAAGKSFSGHMLLGEKNNVFVKLGVAFCFPPTRAGGFTGPSNGFKDTEGRWVLTGVGDSPLTNFERYSDSMGDLMLHTFTGYLTREDIVPSIQKIGIDMSARKAGDRAVVYLDDIGLSEFTKETDTTAILQVATDKMNARYYNKIAQLTGVVDTAKLRMAKFDWTKSMQKIRMALDDAILDADKSLFNLRKNIPFTVFKLARIEDSVAQIRYTVNNLKQLEQHADVSHIVYILDSLTSKNRWILPGQLLIPGRIGKQLSIKGCRGEYEPASFLVKALKELKKVTIDCSDLVCSEGNARIGKTAVDVKLVKCWYQAGSAGASINQRKLPKALIPELLINDNSLVKVDYEKEENYLKLMFLDHNEYRLISNLEQSKESVKNADCPVVDSKVLLPVDIPEGKNQQFWITLKIPDGTPAGNYTGKVRLLSDGTTIDKIDIAVTVFPFDLCQPYYTASIDYQGDPRNDPAINSKWKSKDQILAELKDLVAHGLSNCQHYFYVTDQNLRDVLALRLRAGMDNKILYLKGHGMNFKYTEKKRLEEIKSKVHHIIEIAKEYGTEEVYFYGRDEATGQGLLDQRKAWQAVHEAGGKIFVAGGRDNLVFAGDIQDLQVRAGWPDRKDVAGWHNNGNQVFAYANPQVGIENPETYRRNYGLVMWKYDYDGIANNAYQQTFGFIWNDFDHNVYRSHSFTYPTIDGVVDTIAWEGYREAIDDVRYITTLETIISKMKNSGKHSVAVSNAEKFVNDLRNSSAIETDDLDDLRRKIVTNIIKLSRLSDNLSINSVLNNKNNGEPLHVD